MNVVLKHIVEEGQYIYNSKVEIKQLQKLNTENMIQLTKNLRTL